jgi:sulfate transport system ATP-binding protein
MSIRVENIQKSFGAFHALNDVSLDFPTGELVALLGPSGCGKTTLLRIIAGLENADSGRVYLDGEDASDTHVRERQVGFVFQHYALFKHMTVFDNVAFGLRARPRKERPAEAVIKRKVHQLLELVQLDWAGDRFPAQLSGGQRQRIALARALAVEPRVLLLDEPFGALDAKVRKELRRWLRRLHDELHVTSVFVTHDQDEAIEVSDRIVLINQGKVEQVGSPDEVYQHPASAFVYSFLGAANRFPVAGSDSAIGFARPHETTIITDLTSARAAQGVAARVSRIHAFGTSARVELQAQHLTDASAAPQYFEVELTRQDFEALELTEGRPVQLVPSKLRSFDLAKAA